MGSAGYCLSAYRVPDLISASVLAACKKGVYVINCARGGIIDENALLESLKSSHCAGAGLDVYLEEPPKNTALVEHPKVLCTPHLGASTLEAQQRVAGEIAEQIVALNRRQAVLGVVSVSVMEPYGRLGLRRLYVSGEWHGSGGGIGSEQMKKTGSRRRDLKDYTRA